MAFESKIINFLVFFIFYFLYRNLPFIFVYVLEFNIKIGLRNYLFYSLCPFYNNYNFWISRYFIESDANCFLFIAQSVTINMKKQLLSRRLFCWQGFFYGKPPHYRKCGTSVYIKV